MYRLTRCSRRWRRWLAARRVEFSREAAQEATEAGAWLREHSVAKARRFLLELRHARDLLREHPDAGQVWDGAETPVEVRRWVPRGFPYVVFYVHEGEAVRILAVAHASRRSGYSVERT